MPELADLIMEQLNEPKKKVKKKETKKKVKWDKKEITIPEGCKAFSDIFGWEPQHGDFPVHVFSEADAPEPTDYIWPREQTENFVRSIELGLKPRLIGDAGTGKTELARQFAAITGRAFYRFNFNINTEKEELLGCLEAEAGSTVYKESELSRYIPRPAVILFDEVCRATGEISMILQRFLENKELYMPDKREGENTIYPHSQLALCSADNTLGMGESDVYQTGQVLDPSTLNRWEVAIKLNYQPEKVEIDLIKLWGNIPEEEVENLAKFSKLAQKGFTKRELGLPFSPRNLKAITKIAEQTQDIQGAIRLNYSNALESEEYSTVDNLIKTVWG
jgi:MoxR-like ATPase